MEISLMEKSTEVQENRKIENDEQSALTAVITAALAAYEASTGISGEKFSVKRITRLGGNTWREAGIFECTYSRRI